MAQYYYSDRQVTAQELAFGTWEKVSEVEVTGSAVSSVTFSGLDGDSDKVYLLVAYVYNTDGSTHELGVRLNNDSGTNYDDQYLSGSGTNVTAASRTGRTYVKIGSAYATRWNLFKTLIYAKSGYRRVVISQQGSSGNVELCAGDWNNTTDNVTSVVVVMPAGAYIGVGSRFILFKLSK